MFPVIHTTLDPQALGMEVKRRYNIDGEITCQLVYRGTNDFYHIKTSSNDMALRVAKADFRPLSEYNYELQFTRHLAAAGCRVPASIMAKDGSLCFGVEAPDGLRAIALMDWLQGAPFDKTLNEMDAYALGAALAQVHAAGKTFVPSSRRVFDNKAFLLARLPDLYEVAPKDRDFFAHAANIILGEYEKIPLEKLPFGPCHGDFQYANLWKLTDGSIAIVDFDQCGDGYLAEDIQTFVWRIDMDVHREEVNRAFYSGYESIRPLLGVELDHEPFFRASRALVLACAFAYLINRIGPISGIDMDVTCHMELISRHLSAARLA